MANTWEATLSALAPDHDWKIDEASGTFADQGSPGGFTMSEDESGSMWRQGAGMIRGTPREYALWTSSDADEPRLTHGAGSGGIVASGITTGTWGIIAMVLDDTEASAVLLAQTYDTDTRGLWIEIDVSTGVVTFNLQNFNGVNTGSSAAGVIELGKPYFICGVQRADGNGMRIYVNGVDETDSQTSSGPYTADTFLDGMFGGASEEYLTINGRAQGSDSSRMCLQRPFIFNNTALSDANILALYNAANLDGSPTDYYETLHDLMEQTQWYSWIGGWVTLANGGVERMPVGPHIGAEESGASGFQTPPSALNVSDSSVVSAYPGWRQEFGSNDPVFAEAGGTNIDSAATTGTINVMILLDVAADTVEYPMFAVGDANNDSFVQFGLVGSTFGASVKFRVENFASFFQRVGDDFYTPSGQFMMITAVQIAGGLNLYVDGEAVTGTDSSNVFDDTAWFSDLINTSKSRWGGSPTGADNFSTNDMLQLLVMEKALSAAEVSELWDAANGIFPAPDVPGEWATLLSETGNEGDPNGPGPDHWWRMNEAAAPLADTGISIVDGETIATGGDPDYEVTGPLPLDSSNESVFFDGQGDYFEVGVDAIAGELVDVGIGTIGFFVAPKTLGDDNIAYSQSDNLATAYLKIGLNANVAELFVQTSAGNSVTFTSSIVATDLDYLFIVVTNDGSNYLMYVNGVLDSSATVTTVGIGAEGDWFDSFTATRSAIAARADATFDTETTARLSEIFIYEEVLSAAQILGLWEAALEDGTAGSANETALLVFENVTFRNGGTDISCANALTDLNQFLMIDRCRFVGGAQGGSVQSVLMTGAGNQSGQVRGSMFSLDDTITTGRAAIVGTTASPTTEPTAYSSLVVADCTFNSMGHDDTATRPAVYLESGFGMSVERSRFFDCFAAAIGWRGDAQRVTVRNNVIDTISSAVGAILAQQGLNTANGNGWHVGGNIIEGLDAGDGIALVGTNSSAAVFSSSVQVVGNRIANVITAAISLDGLQALLVQGNQISDGCVEGIRVKQITNAVMISGNTIEDHTADGIILDESSQQIANLVLDRNTIDGSLNANGILVDNVSRAAIYNNKLHNLVTAIELGDIGVDCKISGNQIEAVTSVLALVGATTQAGLQIGENQIEDLGDLETLTVAADTISVSGPHHQVTAGAPTDLSSIGDIEHDGQVVILRLAVGSSNITCVEGGNLVIADGGVANEFEMDTAGESQIWLVRQGGNWYELSRSFGT